MPRLNRPTNRSGFSLLELLIVLAILAAVAGLGSVAVRKPLAKSRLRSAAQELQNQLGRARLRAMRLGKPLHVRYEVDGGRYVVETRAGWFTSSVRGDNSVDSTASDVGWNSDSSTGRIGSANAPPTDSLGDETNPLSQRGMQPWESSNEHKLPRGVHFVQPLTEQAPTERGATGVERYDVTPSDRGLDDRWSEPLVFQPDGRSPNAIIRLQSEAGYFIDVTIRGLTGAVTYTPPRRVPAGVDAQDREPFDPEFDSAEGP